MKNATEWINEIGETVMFSAFVGSNPPGNEVEKLVRRIQVDTLMHAAEVCRKDHVLSILAAGKLERMAQELIKAIPSDRVMSANPKLIDPDE